MISLASSLNSRGWRSTALWCTVVCAAAMTWLSHEIGSPKRVAWHASAEEVIDALGPSADITNYIVAGEAVSDGRTIGNGYRRFWTLGMPVVIALVKGLGGWSWFPLAMAMATAFTWAVALCILVVVFSPRGLPPWGAACGAAVWLYGDLRGWVLGHGAMMSEGMGCGWLLAGFAVLLAAFSRPRLRTFLVAGLLLGVGANFRYQYLMLVRVLLAVLLVAIVEMMRRAGYGRSRVWSVLRGKASDRPGSANAHWMEKSAHGLAVCALVFLLTLVPWSSYKFSLEGTLKWYTASKQLKYGRMWTPDEKQPRWARAANAQCHADPELCAEINANWRQSIPRMKHLALVTTLRHPLTVAQHKLHGFSWLWWGKSWEQLGRRWSSFLEGILLLLSGALSIGFLAFRAWMTRHPAYLLVVVGAATLVLYNAAVFTFLHFEWRFSMPLRVLCAVGPWLAAGFHYRVEKTIDQVLSG